MARVKLTKTLVDDIQPPAKGQAFVWDAEIPGFGVRITPTGIKAWIVQMRVRGGKERRMAPICRKRISTSPVWTRQNRPWTRLFPPWTRCQHPLDALGRAQKQTWTRTGAARVRRCPPISRVSAALASTLHKAGYALCRTPGAQTQAPGKAQGLERLPPAA
ncbi:protein of unknown function [Magnetospirillum sp. XM-1]|nr:protein of unknown function [Magnetospirillum sp. XM-1]